MWKCPGLESEEEEYGDTRVSLEKLEDIDHKRVATFLPPPQTPHTEGPARSCTKKEKK